MKFISPNSERNSQVGYPSRPITIFLAGSIDFGFARDWQNEVIKCFENHELISFFNPRNEKFDTNMLQSINNDAFSYQVNWELNNLERADLIFMFISGDCKSPISLMEMGLFARSGKLIVACEKNFWRRGNVEILCAREGIPLLSSLEDGIGFLKNKIRKQSLFAV